MRRGAGRAQTEDKTGDGSDCVDVGTREGAPRIYLRRSLTSCWVGVDGGGEGGYVRQPSSHCIYSFLNAGAVVSWRYAGCRP